MYLQKSTLIFFIRPTCFSELYLKYDIKFIQCLLAFQSIPPELVELTIKVSLATKAVAVTKLSFILQSVMIGAILDNDSKTALSTMLKVPLKSGGKHFRNIKNCPWKSRRLRPKKPFRKSEGES